jgi:hypothetical protein
MRWWPRQGERKRHTFIKLDIDRTPPDIVLGGLFVDDTLVLGAAAGLLAREIDQGACGRYDGALVADGVLVKKGGRSVALDLDAIHVEAGLGEVVELLAHDYG